MSKAKTFLGLAIVLVLVGCSGGGESPGNHDTKDTKLIFPDKGVVEDVADVSDIRARDIYEQTDGEDFFASRDVQPEEIMPGTNGWPCTKNDDCLTGFCIETNNGRVCTNTCMADNDCGPGFTCAPTQQQPDMIYVCVYKFPRLCLPCKQDGDCKADFTPGDSLCVAWVPIFDDQGNETGTKAGYGNEGAFCGAPCNADADCPVQYVCKHTISVEGKTAKQCVKETGSCGCTKRAEGLHLTGACYIRNDYGTCAGTQQCGTDGMGQCSAQKPAAEVCNHKDDNCDGNTDEGINTKTDTNNCGDCGIKCENPNGATSCVGGKCLPVCDPGFWDCDGDVKNGCESELSLVDSCGRCQKDDDCPGGFFCKDGNCTKKYAGGHNCDDPKECAGGVCTDEGVCCGTACDGPCQSCKTGSCLPADKDGQPEQPDACNGMLCDGNGACLAGCQGPGDCIQPYFCEMTAGDPDLHKCKPDMDLGGNCKGEGYEACKSNFCADGVCCENACDKECRACNAQGKCVPITSGEDPDTCTNGSHCDKNGVCRKVIGQACIGNAQCLSGFCVDGVCCATACGDLCQNCSTGACLPVKDADDAPQCTGTSTCDGAGACKLKEGQTCQKDGDCASGLCKQDFDSTGAWCAKAAQCVHDANMFGQGQYAGDCLDDNNRAVCKAGKWQADPCGQDACTGDCAGTDGCTYNLKGCEAGECFDRAQDNDSNELYCTQCNLQWGLGGNVAATTCCGDDPGEFVRTCDDRSQNGGCGNDTTACCAHADACVDDQGQCMAAGECAVLGAKGQKSYCNAGTWADPDASKAYCTADGCGFTWLGQADPSNRCCGDAPGEDFNQAEGPGRSCCYNGAEVRSGGTSGALLCFNGLMYNCNGKVTDASGKAQTKASCDKVGGLYCTSGNTWSATTSDGCGCSADADCESGTCKADYDSDGAWCGQQTQCAHNAVLYNSGDFSPECFDTGNRAKCNAGTWDKDSCGSDDACSDYYCKKGQCGVTYFKTDIICDPDYKCSSGSGDNNYGVGGAMKCKGFCDGQGNCDYADECENCEDLNGWYKYGDTGPGCRQMDDPTAESRAYYCDSGDCAYRVSTTKDCDDKDGWYGGGDNPGCGNDPDGQQRDYYVDQTGACTFTTDNCPTKSCDSQDRCGAVCDKDAIMAFQDFYVSAGTDSCVSKFGNVTDDCSTKASQDSDGSPTAYKKPGTVTDYTTCRNGQCAMDLHADYCQGTTVYEYGAAGSGVAGPSPYDCQNYEKDYCRANRYLMHDEWACGGQPGYCQDDPNDTQLKDCGQDQCEGTCGNSNNSCMFHQKGCVDAGCFDNAKDPDSSRDFCTGCGMQWAIGGNVAATSCCGDDANEFVDTCTDSSANGNCGSDTQACCTSAGACVDHNGACQAPGACYAFGRSGKKSYCDNQGKWEDPDESQQFCTGAGCGYQWLPNAMGTNSKCCGDDPGEDFEASSGGCCYNGAVLSSGSSQGSIMCYNGQLYNCNGAATDDSGISTTKHTCDPVGNLYCGTSNTWNTGKSNRCSCNGDFECLSGSCKQDFDGSGAWCAGSSQCAHNGQIYSSGQSAEACYSVTQKARCSNGSWSGSDCGTDTSCAHHYCESGTCKVRYYSSSTQCNGQLKCSSGSGSNRYGNGGDYKCQGYCNGSGSCNYAGNCQYCGSDTACTDHYCSNGQCQTNNYGSSHQCNSQFKCSSGSGSNKYGNGGDYKCQGYCDGSGTCNYAGSCQSCGTDTACTNHYCSSGSCGTTYYNSSHSCDSTYRCSSGSGNNKYNTGGNYLCKGLCDGSGNCDYAGSCDNCTNNFPNASGSCSSNSCNMGSCNSGYANCDGSSSNGCEVLLNYNYGSCGGSVSLGQVCGDENCTEAPYYAHGYGEAWYKVSVKECSNWINSLYFKATLSMPSGMDYDLYLYGPCGTLLKQSENGAGVTETIKYSWGDSYGSDDTRWMYLEVKYFSGSNCGQWQLHTYGGCQ